MFGFGQKVKFTLATVATSFLIASAAGATTLSNFVAEFDATDDLLRLSGDITSTASPFSQIGFDWDGALNSFDFTGATLVSSNLGGSLGTPVGATSAGSFAVIGIPSAPLTAPVSFDFLVSVSGISGLFATESIDLVICDVCAPGSLGFENLQDVGTAVAADLSAPPPVPLPAAAWMLLLALGGVFSLKRRPV